MAPILRTLNRAMHRPKFLRPQFRALPTDEEAQSVQGWEGSALLTVILMLVSIGLSTLYSASSYLALKDGLGNYAYLLKQFQGVVMGGSILLVVSQIHYGRWSKIAWPLLGVILVMLIVVLLPGTEAIAPRINGARRWLSLGFLTIQPSEFAKIALLIWTARTLVTKEDRLRSFRRGLLPLLLVWGLTVGLILMEPSLSAAALCLILVGLVALVGKTRLGHFVLLGISAAPLLALAIGAEAYRMKRVTAFLDPSADASGASYQVNQALTAIGSGGIFGRGFGQSKLKFGFLPEPHNDFASAILGEEWGVIGIAVLTLAYLFVGLIGHRIARDAPDDFGALLALGMTYLLCVPALLHLAINLSLLPATGVALPFISYGRSNLLVSFWAAGILLNVAANGNRYRDIRRSLS